MEKPDSSATYVFSDIQVHVLLKGLINYDDERKRIYKGIKKIEKEWKCQKEIGNSDFLNQAPSHIVENVKEKVQHMSMKLEKLHQTLPFLRGSIKSDITPTWMQSLIRVL